VSRIRARTHLRGSTPTRPNPGRPASGLDDRARLVDRFQLFRRGSRLLFSLAPKYATLQQSFSPVLNADMSMDDVLLLCILKTMVQGFFSTKTFLVVSYPVPVIDGESASHLIYLDEEHFPTTKRGEAELIGWGPRSVLPAVRVLAHVWISVWGHRP
jgi:hypothetical protein